MQLIITIMTEICRLIFWLLALIYTFNQFSIACKEKNGLS